MNNFKISTITIGLVSLASYAMEDNNNNFNYEKKHNKRDLQIISSISGSSEYVLRKFHSKTDLRVVESPQAPRARSCSPQIPNSPTFGKKNK